MGDVARATSRVDLGRRRLLTGGAAAGIVAMASLDPVAALARPIVPSGRELSFLNLHTGERLTAEYWHNGRYVPSAMRAISHLLRDHRNGKVHPIDPKLIELVHTLHRKMRVKTPFHVISGYRSPETNALMHEASSGVASHSLHIEGRAIDIRLPGTKLLYLRKAALTMKAGGVGYYPSDDFVHVDTGRVRTW